MNAKKLFQYCAFALLLSWTMACNNNKTATQAVEAEPVLNESMGSGNEYSATFQCVLHCPGSGGESFGTCPVCGRYYMYNPDLPKADSINRALSRSINGGIGTKPEPIADPNHEH
jgi:hypothetical protein